VPLLALLLRSSGPGGLLVWCVIGLCAGIYLFIHGFFLLQRRRLILDTPFSKIRSASMGMVELTGLAVGPYTMPAPLSGHPCYYYRTAVSEWKKRGRSKQWVTVAGECMHLPFFLDDNTGRVMVDPRGAELDIHRDFHEEYSDSFFSTKDPAPASVRNFLERHGVNTENKIKVEEYCIKPKNALFILGTLADNPGLEATSEPVREEVDLSTYSLMKGDYFVSLRVGSGASDEAAFAPRVVAQPDPPQPYAGDTNVLRLSPSTVAEKSVNMTQQQKIVAALLKAGITNPAAWATAGVGPSPTPVSRDSSVDGFDPRPPIVLMKGTNNKAFLISWRSRQEVARSLGWKCTLMIWGGPALVLASLYVMLNIQKLL
jgi:hypothetical protein